MRKIEIIVTGADSLDRVVRLLKHVEPVDYTVLPLRQENRTLISVLVRDGNGQQITDGLSEALAGQTGWRAGVQEVTTTFPPLDEAGEKTRRNKQDATVEEMVDDIAKASAPSLDSGLMMLFSVVIAAAGLISDSAAAVIGSMVIAPIIDPLLAVPVGALRLDGTMLARAGISLAIAAALTVGVGFLIGLFLTVEETSKELVQRGSLEPSQVLFAIAAGGAAAVARRNETSTALVGVMVAAAVVPTATAIGVFLADGDPGQARGAALITLLNVVAVITVAGGILAVSGVRPPTGPKKGPAHIPA